jgi:diguanylate cyclase (GGDEF)-like protein
MQDECNHKEGLTVCENIRDRNYLMTERTVAKFRWLIIGFLFLYFNVFKPEPWPIALFNVIILAAAGYNLGIHVYIGRAAVFSSTLALLALNCDMLAVAAGMYYTGGVTSPFLFVWYLTLFAAGIRFGVLKSLYLQVPMAAFYSYLLQRDVGVHDPHFIPRLVLGLFAIGAVSQLGAVFSREEKFTMKRMADLHKEATTDRLTGLYNYAYFMDEMKREFSRSSRTSSPFSLIIFDLDFFKKVNDAYGHEKGNALLKGVAHILQTNARLMDTVARYGGEEFAVLMPNSIGAEKEAAERLRKKVEEAEFWGIKEGPLKITISAGVCTHPHDAAAIDELLDKTDMGLYAAKSMGRNRVCHCSEV